MFHDVSVLGDLARLPAAPFHEERVAAYILRFGREVGLDTRQDIYGNIILRYRSPDAAGVQPLALVAHMDHPALEITATDGRRARARLLGGVARSYFERAVRVQVHGPASIASGRVTGCRLEEDQSTLMVDLEVDSPAAVGDFCLWDMADFQEDGEYLRLRAADDLAGCAAALATLRKVAGVGLPGDLYGVFTRAEEVGLVGACLVAQDGALPNNTIVVSLEASRTLPGAVVGEGPVIRVGDAQTTFHPEAEALLYEARRRLLRAEPSAKVQRQLMSGGTCEATMFGLMGYRSTGLALPLENYHNMGPADLLLPEAIHRSDFGTAVDLLVRLVEVASGPLTSTLREYYAQRGALHRDRLVQSAQTWTR